MCDNNGENEKDKFGKDLTERLEASDPDSKDTVLILRYDKRSFSAKETDVFLHKRPSESRLFITKWLGGHNLAGGYLRTRFADNAFHASKLRLLRDCVWSLSRDQVQSAKANVTNMLMSYFLMDRSNYHSQVCMIASAFSRRGQNITLQVDPKDYRKGFVPPENVEVLRQRFILMMGIIFRRVKVQRYLIDDEGYNIYNLAYCQAENTDSMREKFHIYWAPLFALSLQMTLMSYVIAEIILIATDKDEFVFHFPLLPLGIFTAIYTMIQSKREESVGRGLMEVINIFVNTLLPWVAVFAGFFVITLQDGFIEGVLNTAALVFVLQIDDELPGFLNMNVSDIVHGCMIRQAVDAVEELVAMPPADLKKKYEKECNQEFIDIMVVNCTEEGSNHEENNHFAPHNIRVVVPPSPRNRNNIINERKTIVDISVGSFISKDSLIRVAKWKFSRSRKSYLLRGYVSRLYIEKMTGEKLMIPDESIVTEDDEEEEGDFHIEEEEGDHEEHAPAGDEWDGQVSGIFFITRYRQVRNITRLRICGTPDNAEYGLSFQQAKDKFEEALDFYSLWELDSRAKTMLQKIK